ncbi:hypothetical protein SARC_14926 [Sphaeroforma arctica JP610]|uniref:Uncharacterized protein n=1 Tax=Sphaeroforma arctica JP610 TaxID=667725 RepID=A0A0L0F793_9EUKA|nr:hypothetical protein SARC_14926 [Sphaeroforma arctica JP610]KNC72514.1 hypothetical protein SARC_14926 [Sphaeroforma arctica JP610]|eukprot:XP_014146416.1 hypothetical protein SARC_14926 [Sphaeroforma arctica JP610]
MNHCSNQRVGKPTFQQRQSQPTLQVNAVDVPAQEEEEAFNPTEMHIALLLQHPDEDEQEEWGGKISL